MWTTFVVLDIRHMEQWWTNKYSSHRAAWNTWSFLIDSRIICISKIFLLVGSVCYVERRCIWAQYRRFWETSILQTSSLLGNKENTITGARERSRLRECGRNGGAIEIIFIPVSPFMFWILGFLRVCTLFFSLWFVLRCCPWHELYSILCWIISFDVCCLTTLSVAKIM